MATVALSVRQTATVGDFFALLKPRVMSLVVFTGLAGMIVAPTPQGLSPARRLAANACTSMIRNTITPAPAMNAPMDDT